MEIGIVTFPKDEYGFPEPTEKDVIEFCSPVGTVNARNITITGSESSRDCWTTKEQRKPSAGEFGHVWGGTAVVAYSFLPERKHRSCRFSPSSSLFKDRPNMCLPVTADNKRCLEGDSLINRVLRYIYYYGRRGLRHSLAYLLFSLTSLSLLSLRGTHRHTIMQ
jgi:hypothetical protein